MKRIINFILCAVLIMTSFSVFSGCSADKRENTLKLFSQGAYFDESLFEEFEEWYEEKSGKKITVTMEDFNSNEDMYNKVSMAKADYDLICPSDYMIQKMIRENLIIEIDKSIIDISEEDLFVEDYIEATKLFDPDLKYSVPFMYGTFGIMTNIKFAGRVYDKWEDLLANDDKEQILYLKYSMRDTYSAASIFSKSDELLAMPFSTQTEKSAYKATIQSIFSDTSTENIANVKSILKQWKGKNRLWDDEDGKFAMADNRGTAGLFWSCDAGYVMSDYENDAGVELEGNKNLWFVIPKEGGNVYLDSFVISKYAKNVEAAQYFLQFICSKEAALRNSEYIGAVSPVKEAYDELKEALEAEEIDGEDSTFCDFPDYYSDELKQAWKEMYIEMLFPSHDTLMRCGQMVDYVKAEDAVMRAMTEVLS